jgi:hypothetical protein
MKKLQPIKPPTPPTIETKFVVRSRSRRGQDEHEVHEVNAIFQGDVVFVFPKNKSTTPQRADKLDPTQVYDTQEEAQKAIVVGHGKVRWVCHTDSLVPEVFQARVARNSNYETSSYTRLDTGKTGFLGYGYPLYETRADALKRAASILGNYRPFDFEHMKKEENARHERELKSIELNKTKLEKLLRSLRGAHVKLPDNYRKRAREKES